MKPRRGEAGMLAIPSTVLRLTDTVPAEGATTLEAPGHRPMVHGGRVGRYEVVRVLGEGGMGHVDQVRDRDLLRDVAAKYLLPELIRDRPLLDQFLWEARVTAYLDHPNIVPVHELGTTDDGRLFFTMKLARGATLEDDLRAAKGKASPDEDLPRRLRIFVAVCNAVAFAHARGVLHRDLKPANVLVGEYGEVLVGDWGLSLPLPTAGEDLRAIVPEGLSQRSAGTPMYMSPEQARGDALDARSDIYTLGAILYELVCLRPPMEGESLPEVLANVVAGRVARYEPAGRHVSPALAAVVDKAMSLDPSGRYDSAAELAEEVETVLDGRTPRADHASLVTQAARYYVSRDPAFGKMRVFDVDLWMVSTMFLGAAIAARFSSHIGSYWWALLIGSAMLAARPTGAWLKHRLGRRS